MTKTSDELQELPLADAASSGLRDWQLEIEERVRKLESAIVKRTKPVVMDEESEDRVLVLASNREAPLTPPHSTAPYAASPPQGAVLHPPNHSYEVGKRTWFLSQLWIELRLAAQMYFDSRYRISRTTQFALPAIAILLIGNYFLFNAFFLSIPVLSPIAERLLDVVLCVVGYTLVTRELVRYRDVLDYLNRFNGV